MNKKCTPTGVHFLLTKKKDAFLNASFWFMCLALEISLGSNNGGVLGNLFYGSLFFSGFLFTALAAALAVTALTVTALAVAAAEQTAKGLLEPGNDLITVLYNNESNTGDGSQSGYDLYNNTKNLHKKSLLFLFCYLQYNQWPVKMQQPILIFLKCSRTYHGCLLLRN
jgi:hypothetical protein